MEPEPLAQAAISTSRNALRRLATAVLVAGALTLNERADAQVPASPPGPAWAIPSNDEIRRLLADRIDVQRQDAGIVVGVFEPAGRRVVAYGSSDTRDGRRLDGNTVFQVGSITKLFTTLLAAEMAQRGEVDLDGPLSALLPEAVLAGGDRAVTLRDLTMHYSGLPSMPTNFDLRAKPNPYEAYTLQQLRHFLATHRLTRSPGERWQYSNLGVSVLGRALARRAGTSYEPLLRSRVLEPLGLRSTSVTLTKEQASRLSPGHDIYLQPVETWNLRTLPASGALRSTANDMLTFVSAYLGDGPPALRAAMDSQFETRRPAGGTVVQGLGWGILRVGQEEIALHDGGKEGYRAFVAINRRTRTGVVVLSNTRSLGRLDGLALHLLTGRALRAMPAVRARVEVRLQRRDLDACTGTFRLASGEALEVARRDNRLLVHFPGDGVSVFLAEGPRAFFSNTDDIQIAFQSDATDKVSGLVLTQGGRTTSGHRSAPAS